MWIFYTEKTASNSRQFLFIHFYSIIISLQLQYHYLVVKVAIVLNLNNRHYISSFSFFPTFNIFSDKSDLKYDFKNIMTPDICTVKSSLNMFLTKVINLFCL